MPAPFNSLVSTSLTPPHSRVTIYAVVNVRDIAFSAQNGAICRQQNGSLEYWEVAYSSDGDGNVTFQAIDQSSENHGVGFGSDPFPADEWLIVSAVFDRTQTDVMSAVKLRVNGAQQGEESPVTISFPEPYEEIPIECGSLQAAGVGNLRMKDLLVFIDVAHDDATLAAFEAMLAAKEGISL